MALMGADAGGPVAKPGQTNLVDEWKPYIGRVPSSTTEHVYTPVVSAHTAWCQCVHAKMQGNGGEMQGVDKFCVHATKTLNAVLVEQVRVWRSRIGAGNVAAEFVDAIEVMAKMLMFRKAESNIVAGAFMMQAFAEGEVCADDIHALVGDLITGDTRLIGAVTAGLLVKKLVVSMGTKRNSSLFTKRSREIKRFGLTAEGREMVTAAMLAKRPGANQSSTAQTPSRGEVLHVAASDIATTIEAALVARAEKGA